MEKNRAAQKRGCRAEICFLLGAVTVARPTGRTGAVRLIVLGGIMVFADTNLNGSFIGPGETRFRCGRFAEINPASEHL